MTKRAPRFRLRWKRAADFRDIPDNVIYVFGRAGKPFYVGKAARFGRRYTYGYHHLINAFLDLGGFLYYAAIPRWELALSLEAALVRQWKPRFNKSKSVSAYAYTGAKPWHKAPAKPPRRRVGKRL